MCGIAGFFGAGDGAALDAMLRRMAYRGPDAENGVVDRGLHLGHLRLSIVDLAGGSQPMWTEDRKLCVTFNGEIYNQAELRRELEASGAVFQTDHSDTEVLLHGYRIWGEAMLERLNGMWAFVIYDRETRTLFGARDRFGKKPLYYLWRGETFVFASELAAIMEHPAVASSVSRTGLMKYFAYGYVPGPHSLIEGVKKLGGGEFFRVGIDSGEFRIRRWWEYEIDSSSKATDQEELCEQLRGLLSAAVQRRLMSDVPLGLFLSGGIDSSAVAALAARTSGGKGLSAFSIGFTDPSFDELPYAKQAAQEIGLPHEFEVLDLEQARRLLPEIISLLDEPNGDSSLLPTWLLCRFTKKHATVALGGDGGDELFAGYDPFKALRKAELYSRLVPQPVHAGIRMMAATLPVSHRNVSLDFKIKRTLLGLSHPQPLWCPTWMGPLDPSGLSEYFGEAVDPEDVYSEAIAAWEAVPGGDVVDRATQFFVRLYLQDGVLGKVDRASMLNSLEVRAPLLDIDVANFARRLPHDLRYHRGTTKYLLKKALEPVLPPSILYRRKKGFGTPVGPWLASGAIAPDPDASLNPAMTRRLLDEHRTGKADHRLFLWCEWVLQQWASANNLRLA